MRPDLEDYEELSDEAPRSRAMSWLVLVVAVGGFAALAYYAYHSGSQSMQDGQVLVVEADRSAIKEAPVDPQGEEFPNQDKTIYEAIAPEAANRNNVEKLLPEPEEPVIPEPAVEQPKPAKQAETTTYVSKSLDTNDAPMDPVDAQSMKQPAPAPAPEAKVEAPKQAAPAAPAAPAVKPEPAKAPSAGAPVMVNTKPTVAAAPKPQAATGSYKVQLGAFKSDAEARAQWSKIAAKNGDVLKGGPVVVKADLPNGTFYRLRASGFASPEAAKAACATLSGRGQACFFAGK